MGVGHAIREWGQPPFRFPFLGVWAPDGFITIASPNTDNDACTLLDWYLVNELPVDTSDSL